MRRESPRALEKKLTASITLLKRRKSQFIEPTSSLSHAYEVVIADFKDMRRHFTEYWQMKRTDYPFQQKKRRQDKLFDLELLKEHLLSGGEKTMMEIWESDSPAEFQELLDWLSENAPSVEKIYEAIEALEQEER